MRTHILGLKKINELLVFWAVARQGELNVKAGLASTSTPLRAIAAASTFKPSESYAVEIALTVRYEGLDRGGERGSPSERLLLKHAIICCKKMLDHARTVDPTLTFGCVSTHLDALMSSAQLTPEENARMEAEAQRAGKTLDKFVEDAYRAFHEEKLCTIQ